ncbi:MAG: terminase [Prevotella sp.]
MSVIDDIIQENARRRQIFEAVFNPITGEGAPLKRKRVTLSDFALPVMYLPLDMLKDGFIKSLIQSGSIASFLKSIGEDVNDDNIAQVVERFVRTRIKYDFAFWCAMFVLIKPKGGGEDVHFNFNFPQRKLVEWLENKRLANMPIRLVLLKARQWGGSTVIQMYMAWLQLVHCVGLNSLIVAHVKDTSTEIMDMFDKMISEYPLQLLHKAGEQYKSNEKKFVSVGGQINIKRVPQRLCKIKIGTAEKPDSCRGGDYNLVHLSEVGVWKRTEGKDPRDIVRAATKGILLKALTMIVYESTANGTGNFFHREYVAAKEGKSQFSSYFVPWYLIEQYQIPIDNIRKFAEMLYAARNNEFARSEREEPGAYLWWLWEKGATLEGIAWYIAERAGVDDHGAMASETPTDDIEAFVHSGLRVFDKYKVEKLRKGCRTPKYIGELQADGDSGKEIFSNLIFSDDHQGNLWVWNKPEIDEHEKISNRYLVVVDIGGRSSKADWSVIVVFDRLGQMDGEKPLVVAQWYGHIDMDLLAWKAAQIAKWYDDALLVIESNTLETKDRERVVDGDQSQFILNQVRSVYSNLYARKQSEDEIQHEVPKKYGFHTNVLTKPMIISTLVKVIREKLYIERDERCIDEYIDYERKPNGSFGAIVGKHDDLLMTRAIGLHIALFEMPLPVAIVRRSSVRSTASRRKRPISEATII